MTKFPFPIPADPSDPFAPPRAAPRKLFTLPLVEGARIAPGSLANAPAAPPSAAEQNAANRALFGLPEPAPADRAVTAPKSLAELNARNRKFYGGA